MAGRRAVLEALQAGRRVNKVVVAEHAEGGSLSEIIAKASSLGIVVQKVPRSTLSRLAGDHHQGVLAYVSPYEYVDLEDVIGRDTGQLPLVVLLDGVTDPHNVGAIVRTAEAAGAQGVVLPKRRSAPLTSTVAKAAAGALEYIPVARVTNLVQAMEQLKRRGYWLVGADVAGSVPYTRFDYRVPVAVVIGSEGKGLGRLVKERCDQLVRLPMLGRMESLNASVAAGVLLYEVVRQRS